MMFRNIFDRRTFFKKSAFWVMMGGLVSAYGTFAGFALRFLFPAREQERRWLFVCRSEDLDSGESMLFTAPNGARINVARQSRGSGTDDFIALSSVCPHLGCQVHWELANQRFFCPCHNGVFDRSGKGIGGPPGDAKQSLPRYPLRIENGLLLIEVPIETLRT
jgi:nitrite reductase/ring-hydroxylating ferredoxin subunit